MNKDICRIAMLAFVCLSMPAIAAPPPPPLPSSKADIPIKGATHTFTCKNMNPGQVFKEPDGGGHQSSQGWFAKAEVAQSTTRAFVVCHYGADKVSPSERPVYQVTYTLTGYMAAQCTVQGAAVTCTR